MGCCGARSPGRVAKASASLARARRPQPTISLVGMDLFDQKYRDEVNEEQPLAARMRPRRLDEFIGQEHIVGPGRLLYRAIQADQLSSIIFYGPPGTGKTSLAVVIANTTKSHFVTINAVLSGVKEIRQSIELSKERRKLHGVKTILFVDEVHRWNKAQQDALLPWVENGTVILIGATIENPYFEVNRALVSRSRVFQLQPLTDDHLRRIAHRAFKDHEMGYGRYQVSIETDALDHLVKVSNGDARSLLNALQLAVETTPNRFPPEPGEIIHIDMRVAEESIQKRVVLYDKEGDYHFDTISAFIKSLRGSDPDAALYWVAKMIHAGEDPHFIFRRMLIFASEDIGMADPQALVFTEAAAAAFDRVGLPEGRFHLANAVLYLSTAPKSNSIFAFFDALGTVENEREGEVPSHLKDGSRDKESFGHGEGYLYPHAYRDHWVLQQYLPESLQGKIFYNPGSFGYEAGLKTEIKKRRETQLSAMLELSGDSQEILTFSPPDTGKERWLARAAGSLSSFLGSLRDRLFAEITVQRHSVALDINADHGLLTWELMRRVPEGGVWARINSDNTLVRDMIRELPELDRPALLVGELANLNELIAQQGKTDLRFDLIVGRNAIGQLDNKQIFFHDLAPLLQDQGMLALAEAMPRSGQRLSELVDTSSLSEDVLRRFREAENRIYTETGNPRVNWDHNTLQSLFEESGYQDVRVSRDEYSLNRTIKAGDLNSWFAFDAPSALVQGLRATLQDDEIRELADLFKRQIAGTEVQWKKTVVFLFARKG